MVTRTVHFTIQGEWLTEFSRSNFWEEHKFDYARELLGTLIGITPEQIDGILLGKYCLTGTSEGEGVVMKDDVSNFKKTYDDMNLVMRQKIKGDIQNEKDKMLSEEARMVFDYAEETEMSIDSRRDYNRCLELAILKRDNKTKHDIEVHRENLINLGRNRLNNRIVLDRPIEQEMVDSLDDMEWYFKKNPKSIGAKKENLILGLKQISEWSFEQIMNYVKLYDEGKLNELTDNCFISPQGLIFSVPNLGHMEYADPIYWFWNKVLDLDKDDFGIGNDSDLIDVKGFVAISAANFCSGAPRIRASGRGIPITKKQEELILKYSETQGFLDSIGLNSRDKFIDNRNDVIKACQRQRLEEKEWKK